ncbi:hypothetical protein B0H19DRAFT_1088044 [Mycena capillaripes]|nr:hypothetical protein B0H19DRAFT_1088044 [Mycena capillaripes]
MFDHPDFTAPATNHDFFTGPVPDPQTWDPKFNTWNAKHHAVKRVSPETFVLVGQGQNSGVHVVISAKQVALFITHNEELWYNQDAQDRDCDPLGYAQFAMHLNAYDSSTDLWAFYDNQAEIPTWGTWSVFPQHIGEFRVPSGMALVSKERKDLVERQWERNLLRQEESRRKRELGRQTRDLEPYPTTKRNKDDMRAAISARGKAVRNDSRAAVPRTTARQGHRRNNQAVPAPAPVPLAQPAPVVLTQPLQMVVQPVGPAHTPASGSSQNIPPITTIDPAHFASHDDSDALTNLATMTNEEFMEMMGKGSGQTQEDATMEG